METVFRRRRMGIERKRMRGPERHVRQNERERGRRNPKLFIIERLHASGLLHRQRPIRQKSHREARHDEHHAFVLGKYHRVRQYAQKRETDGVAAYGAGPQIGQRQKEIPRYHQVEIRAAHVPTHERQRRERIYGDGSPNRIGERGVGDDQNRQPKQQGDGIHEGLVPFSGDVREVGLVEDELERVLGMSSAAHVRETLGIVGFDLSGVVDFFGLGVPVSLFVVEIRRDVVNVEGGKKQLERHRGQERNDEQGFFPIGKRNFRNEIGNVLLKHAPHDGQNGQEGEGVFPKPKSDARPRRDEHQEPYRGDAQKVAVREKFDSREAVFPVDFFEESRADGERCGIAEYECEEGHGMLAVVFLKDD